MKIPEFEFGTKAKIVFKDPSRGGKIFDEIKENIYIDIDNLSIKVMESPSAYAQCIEVILLRDITTIEWLRRDETVVGL